MSDKVNKGRRQLMKTAGVGAAALSMAGLDVASALAAPPSKWDEETDVLIAGYGGGGAATAIYAADAGAQVLILEKNPADLHVCNTNVSSGAVICPIDAEKAALHIKTLTRGTVDDEMCRVWGEEMMKNEANLKKLADAVGIPSETLSAGHTDFPNLPGGDGIRNFTLKAGAGQKYFEVLDKNVKARKNIKVAWTTPAKKIVQGNGGEILGIIAERNGKEIAIRGRRATVLATGGYEFNEKLKRVFYDANPIHFFGTDSNTGDGLIMAMAAGADLWHMVYGTKQFGFFYNEIPVGMTLRTSGGPASFMIVDQYGKRYFNDHYSPQTAWKVLEYCDPITNAYPRNPSYLIFDEKFRLGAGPLTPSMSRGSMWGAKVAKYKYYWSKDQSAEVAKGWIMKADTLVELGKKINERQGPNPIVDYPSTIKMDPAVLEATTDKFNEYAKNGSDPEFDRKNLKALEGPFYATELWLGGVATHGGPRYNVKGQVIDLYGKPIPRLYKAGELGSFYTAAYPCPGSHLGEILAFGRIAGQNAAKEKPQV